MSPIETERSCYILIDISVLNELLNKVSSCPECNEREISIMNNLEKKSGLACNLVMSSNRCNWSSELYSSREIEQNNTPGRNPFDINIRTIMAFREIGKGYSALETFCGIMNMPAPMNVKAFNEMQLKIADAYIKVSKTSMTDVAEEMRQDNIQEGDSEHSGANITVSCDGTWQKRGHSSLNGVVTVIAADTGKCLDYRVLSKHCDACNSWEHKKKTEPEKYDNFMATHECSINHVGSAGSMEASGLKECFMTSVETNKLRYTNYIGDGDSKSYNDIFQTDLYEGIGVNKLECIGHIQKRVGTRLRKLKSANTKAVLSDGKKLSGQGRLTEKFINKLQNYYRIAIRSSCHGNVYSLKKAIAAVLYHCSEASSLEA